MKHEEFIRASFLLTSIFLAAPVATANGGEEEVVGLREPAPYEHAAVTAKILELGREKNEVMTHLRILTKDIGPRMTSSQGLIEAQEWARYTFERWGMESWLEKWGEFPVGFDRGPTWGKMEAEGETKDLHFITMAWSAGTSGPERGPAIIEPDTEEGVDAIMDQLPGAWIVRRNGRRPKTSVRKYLDEACAKQGAAGFVRKAGGDGLLVTGGSYRIKWDDLPTTVTVRLRADEFDDMYALLDDEKPVTLEFDIQNYFRKGPIDQHNVIADIKGTEFPDEYVIIQAHIDSWDGAEGAADNGTGVSSTMEAARILMLAGVQPKRTIRFVLYSGEEQGLFGSKGYVRDHKDEHDKISVVLNHDHGTRYLSGISTTVAMMEDFQTVFAEVMELDPERPFKIREVGGLTPGPSDHAPFVSAGIPGFFWDQSAEGYKKIHHTQYDTYEETSPEELHHSVMVIALAAHNFANLDHMLDRTDMKEPEPRRMGVYLSDSGSGVREVIAGGKAAEAGWKDGDRIVSIDGVEVSNRREVVRELQAGGPVKLFVIEREGDEDADGDGKKDLVTIETTLDYSNDADEDARARRRQRRGGMRGRNRDR